MALEVKSAKASKKGKKEKAVIAGGIDAQSQKNALDIKGKGKATMPAVTAGKKPKKEGRKANGKAAAVPAPSQAAEAEPELDEAGLLLREIKSLGGDEEDFKFLKDVDVDDEDEAIVNDTVEDVSVVPAAVHGRALFDILLCSTEKAGKGPQELSCNAGRPGTGVRGRRGAAGSGG